MGTERDDGPEPEATGVPSTKQPPPTHFEHAPLSTIFRRGAAMSPTLSSFRATARNGKAGALNS